MCVCVLSMFTLKPYLLYRADVINWTRSELASISVAFNTAMFKIYIVKFGLLDDIYKYVDRSDVADVIICRRRRCPHSMPCRVCVTVGCPSVCSLSVCLSRRPISATECGGFAAESSVSKIYRSIAAGAVQQVKVNR